MKYSILYVILKIGPTYMYILYLNIIYETTYIFLSYTIDIQKGLSRYHLIIPKRLNGT